MRIHSSRRRAKAPDYLKEAIGKQEKANPKDVKIDRSANEFLMQHVVTRSAPIKLTVEKTGQTVSVRLFQEKKPAAQAAAQKSPQQRPSPKPQPVAPAAAKQPQPQQSAANAAPANKEEKAQKPKKEAAPKEQPNANQQPSK